MNKQYSFPRRVGLLIEDYIIKQRKFIKNTRQNKYGYYDAYNSESIFEIKAAKDNNYFRINQKNHKLLKNGNGSYILVNYHLTNNDKELSIQSNIELKNIQQVKASEIQKITSIWLEDQRKSIMYYKIKL